MTGIISNLPIALEAAVVGAEAAKEAEARAGGGKTDSFECDSSIRCDEAFGRVDGKSSTARSMRTVSIAKDICTTRFKR